MSTWKSLLAACCLLPAAAPSGTASDAGSYRGTATVVIGACSISQTPEGRLQISNLGSSGQDGVDFICPNLDGVRCPLASSVSDADSGADVSFRFQWHLTSQPARSSATLMDASTATPDRIVYTPTLASLTAAAAAGLPAMQRVRLLRAGAVVYDVSLPALTSVGALRTAGVACPLGALSCYLDRASHTECCAVEFPAVQHCVVAGHDADCDGFVVSAAFAGDGLGDDASLRVAAPPASSLGTVSLSGLDVAALGHLVSGQGQVALQGALVSGQRRLEVHNLGSSGQDGVLIHSFPTTGTQPPSFPGIGAAVDCRFAPPSLALLPGADAGAASVTRVLGSSSVVTDGVLATQAITVVGNSFSMRCDFSGIGADAESVCVLNQGLEVVRAAVSLGSSVLVLPPPNAPLGMAINEKGLPGDKPRKKTTARSSASVGYDAAQPAGALASPGPDEVPFVLGFRNLRVFAFGGQEASGDQVFCWGGRYGGGAGGSLSVRSQEELVTAGSSPSSQHDVELLDTAAAASDAVSADAPPSACLSSVRTCVNIPFVFHRTDATPARAFSVTFHLSTELAKCGAGITEGDYLNSVGPTQMFVTDNGGGSYTVDCGALGTACGATGDGTLFSLAVSAVQPVSTAMGTVVVDAVRVRDCSNATLPAGAGAAAFIPVAFTSPAALAGLSAAQVIAGNPAGGTTGVTLSWSPPAALDAGVSVYRKGFGNYPFYDKGSAPGSMPPPPATPEAALSEGWTLAGCRTPGEVDLPAARDFFYYCAFVTDVFGNASPVSSRTDGTLDYHLGDVSDGLATCSGDDHVSIADISFLGAHYGQGVSQGSSFSCLDVGPTTDYSVSARPTTDGRVDFEDFMMFAIDYGAVSAPRTSRTAAPALSNVAHLAVPASAGVGSLLGVGLDVEGAGDAQAMSVHLDYDHAVLEQVGVSPGDMLAAQDRQGAVLSSGSGDVDVALLGAGGGISGSGELARVTFRVLADGDPQLSIAAVTARDGRNHAVAVAGFAGVASGASLPARAGLGFAFPDPFRSATNIHFGIREPGAAKLEVYDVAGRRVRVLVRGVQAAGSRTVSWDGSDDSGVRLAPGAYIVHFEAGGRSESRSVRLVR